MDTIQFKTVDLLNLFVLFFEKTKILLVPVCREGKKYALSVFIQTI